MTEVRKRPTTLKPKFKVDLPGHAGDMHVPTLEEQEQERREEMEEVLLGLTEDEMRAVILPSWNVMLCRWMGKAVAFLLCATAAAGSLVLFFFATGFVVKCWRWLVDLL